MHFVYLFFCWWTFSCFHCLAVMNNDAMDMCVPVFMRTMFSFLLGIYLGMEFLGHMNTLGSIFWGTAGLFSPHSHQCLLFSAFFIIAILVDVMWYLTVVFICIALMTKDVEHLFHVFIGHLHTFFGKMSVQILCPVLTGLFVFLLLSCKSSSWASLVAQWLGIRLPMQGTRVRALVWEDPTCRGATRAMSHNYWACASGACAPQQERPRQWEARAPRWGGPRLPQLEKALAQKRRPNTAKNK